MARVLAALLVALLCGSAATAENRSTSALPRIFALDPAVAAGPQRAQSSKYVSEDAALVLRAARQLRLSMYALTRQLPLLDCCGASSHSPDELVTVRNAAETASAVAAASAAPVHSIVIGLQGSMTLEAVWTELRANAGIDLTAVALLEDRLGLLATSDDHVVHALEQGAGSILFCIGASPIATMYAVSTALEQTGIRFHLHGDSMPRPEGRTPTVKSVLDKLASVQLLQTPSMSIRGILPFHDFVSISYGP